MAFFEGGDGSGSLVRVNPTRPAAAAKAVYSSPAPAPQVVANPDNQARPSGYARLSQTMAAASGRPPAGSLAKGGSSTPAPRNAAASPAAVRIASMLVSRIGRTSPFQNAGIAATRGSSPYNIRNATQYRFEPPNPLDPTGGLLPFRSGQVPDFAHPNIPSDPLGAVKPLPLGTTSALDQLGQQGGFLKAPSQPDALGARPTMSGTQALPIPLGVRPRYGLGAARPRMAAPRWGAAHTQLARV